MYVFVLLTQGNSKYSISTVITPTVSRNVVAVRFVKTYEGY